MKNEMTPAARLSGLELAGGWTVREMIRTPEDATGGASSRGYRAERTDGTLGFLKALDLAGAAKADDPAAEAQKRVDRFQFERAVLSVCQSRRLSHIVAALDSGVVEVPHFSEYNRVNYILFELADGDIRRSLDGATSHDSARSLRHLHNVTVALRQLHMNYIAHQDVKPSNILLFRGSAKLADLGRASQRGQVCPCDALLIAGDPHYAPPEQLYRHVDPDWHRRRVGGDAYQLGSLIYFFFTRISLTSALLSKLTPSERPHASTQSYTPLLPAVRKAFNDLLRELRTTLDPALGSPSAAELTAMVEQLCDPDPSLRGHPLDRRFPLTQHSLERYVSRLDALARRTEIHQRRARAR